MLVYQRVSEVIGKIYRKHHIYLQTTMLSMLYCMFFCR